MVERLREALGVASYERLAQLGLAGEVVVEAGLGEGELGGYVCVAEAVEAADLSGCERSPKLNQPAYVSARHAEASMGPSRGLWLDETGDAKCLAASVSESGHEGRWSVECGKRVNANGLPTSTNNPRSCQPVSKPPKRSV